MKIQISDYTDKILEEEDLSSEELNNISENADTESLLKSANYIRKVMKGSQADLCAAINIKSGRCSEDCRYCSQSGFYNTHTKIYDMVDYEKVWEFAEHSRINGIRNLGLSSSGGALSQLDKEKLLSIYQKLSSRSEINLCGAHGILKDEEEARQLKEAGLDTYEHNLQTSKRYYPNICTTHSYEERINTIKFAINAGLKVCSGGIIGLGENMTDRIDMAILLRDLGVLSVPINILNPVPGTPCGDKPIPLTKEEALRSMAIFRLALPKANLIYGAGRNFMGTDQSQAFSAGLNGIVVGNFLTIQGNSIAEDIALLKEQGLEPSPDFNKMMARN